MKLDLDPWHPDHDYIVIIHPCHYSLLPQVEWHFWINSSLFIYVTLRCNVHSFERGWKHSCGLRDLAGGCATKVGKQTFPFVTWWKADR